MNQDQETKSDLSSDLDTSDIPSDIISEDLGSQCSCSSDYETDVENM